MKNRLLSTYLGLGALALAPALHAQELLVPSQFSTIQDAINAAPDGATILIQPQTYLLSAPLNTLGKALTLRPSSDVGTVTLDGMGATRILRVNSGESADTVFQGLVFFRGSADSGSGTVGGGGGGVLVESASPTFVDCTFEACVAGSGQPAPQLANGFRGGHGGAVFVDGGSVLFDRCLFVDNAAGNGGLGGQGSAGILGGGVTPVDGGDGSEGKPGGRGGSGSAVYGISPTTALTIRNCVFDGNLTGSGGTGGTGGQGGDGTLITVLEQTFFLGNGGNGADGGVGGTSGDGAVYISSGAWASVRSCTFVGNRTGSAGAGGSGAPGGAGVAFGASGSAGATGACSARPGVVIDGFSSGDVINSLFFDELPTCASPTGFSEIVMPTDPEHCATRSSVSGPGSFTINSSGLGDNYDPIFNGPLIDAGLDVFYADPGGLDFGGGARSVDYPQVVTFGPIDIGAQEYSTGQWTGLSIGCPLGATGSLFPDFTPPAVGGTASLTLRDSVGAFPAGSLALLAGSAVTTGGSCGIPVPGWGLSPGLPGYYLLAEDPTLILFGSTTYVGGGATWDVDVPIPDNDALVGLTYYFQGAFVNPANFDVGLTDSWAAFFGE